ncbi:MAG: RCC1 domain-containing protein [Limnochordia bacterium]|jgi:alpha-tubulin suppressor-like RCC1 family protein
MDVFSQRGFSQTTTVILLIILAIVFGGCQRREFTGGSGTKDDPYLVATAKELNNVRYYLDKHFRQVGDIDLARYSLDSSLLARLGISRGNGWKPIGSETEAFTGTYDGDGHRITSLGIDSSQIVHVGLFACLGSGAELKNMKLETVHIQGEASRVGGLVGAVLKANARVVNCSVSGSVAGVWEVGALVGHNQGSILNCYATGDVVGSGGLVGYNAGEIRDSYASCTVTGRAWVGGLVGTNSGGTIVNTYATGSIEGPGCGGLVGYNTGDVIHSYATGHIRRAMTRGGLVASNSGSIVGSFYDRDGTGVLDFGKGSPKTTAEMVSRATYVGWDFDSTWEIDDGRYYPYLRSGYYPHVDKKAVGIAAGDSHSVVLRTDGTVWTWGWNSSGQLGNGSFEESLDPVQVEGLRDMVAITACENYTAALAHDGTVWVWGRNEYGQLGDENLANSPIPVQIPGLGDIILIAGGPKHIAAVDATGSVWTWGSNDCGQLGYQSDSKNYVPIRVNGLEDIVTVALGANHTIALDSGGTVWAWGDNSLGQLGNALATMDDYSIPVPVADLTNIVSIAAGAEHSVALQSDGTVWTWGSNRCGQLGQGDMEQDYSYQPVPVVGLSAAVIGTGEGHTIIVVAESAATSWAWGRNESGQLGDGTEYLSRHPIGLGTPVQVKGPTNIIAVVGGSTHSLALRVDGTVWSWGTNNYRKVLGPRCKEAVGGVDGNLPMPVKLWQ